MSVDTHLEREVVARPRSGRAPRATWIWPRRSDPRLPFALILASYCALGVFVLGFNRTPLQVVLTIGACMGFEVLFQLLFKRGEKVVPPTGQPTNRRPIWGREGGRCGIRRGDPCRPARMGSLWPGAHLTLHSPGFREGPVRTRPPRTSASRRRAIRKGR
jgi:hypothetical protein